MPDRVYKKSTEEASEDEESAEESHGIKRPKTKPKSKQVLYPRKPTRNLPRKPTRTQKPLRKIRILTSLEDRKGSCGELEEINE